jgi:hypothetical protein
MDQLFLHLPARLPKRTTHRNKTAVAAADPAKAWTAWTLSYNVTFINASEAAYRRQIFEFNLAKAAQLNTLAGPDVAVRLLLRRLH